MPSGMATSTTLKRIQREITDLQKEDLGSITLGPSEHDLFHWTASLPGPDGSVYEGGVFNVDIHLATDYPFSAPKMAFRTRIYHMNISDRGGICIDILKHNWSPALSLFKVILSLSSLLTDPNPKDPLVPAIAQEYTRNRARHDQTAREWTRLYARPPPPPPPQVAAPAAPPQSKGKERAPTSSNARVNPAAAPDRVRRSGAAEVITIDDSDEERGAPATTASQQRQGGVKRKRAADGDAGSTASSSSEEPVRVRRKRGETPTSRACQTNGSTTSTEVIVIED